MFSNRLYCWLCEISFEYFINNNIVDTLLFLGTPVVECGSEQIKFTAKTKKPFTGKVFVKGEFSNKSCVNYYTPTNNGIINLNIFNVTKMITAFPWSWAGSFVELL